MLLKNNVLAKNAMPYIEIFIFEVLELDHFFMFFHNLKVLSFEVMIR